MTQVAQLAVAELKRDFRRVLDAAQRGETTVVLRHGRPVAVVAPVRMHEGALPAPRRPGGLLAVLGLFEDWPPMEADMAEIVAMRREAVDRPAPELD